MPGCSRREEGQQGISVHTRDGNERFMNLSRLLCLAKVSEGKNQRFSFCALMRRTIAEVLLIPNPRALLQPDLFSKYRLDRSQPFQQT